VPQPTRGCPLQENLAPQRSARTALYLNVTLFNICVRNAKNARLELALVRKLS
jgi:hypothetical protein